MPESPVKALLEAARQEGREEAAGIAVDFLANHPDLAIGSDLDILAARAGSEPRRSIIDDGRDPDYMTGMPLETDTELRARLTGKS